MNQLVFEDCLKYWKESDGHSSFWPDLCAKWNYSDPERMRQDFKYERKKRGIKKEDKSLPTPAVVKKVSANHNAKILLFDIETTPIQAFVWGLWDQDVSHDAIVEDWHLISWSAKWLFSDKIESSVLTPKEAKQHDDTRVSFEIWKLLNEADIVVSHNGDRFDLKRLNTRFIKNGFVPAKPSLSIDTLQVAKTTFSFTSNKLDYINDFLGLPKKIHTDFSLWIGCFYGDEQALAKMEEYNRGDTEILEDLYLKLRPYMRNHPNLNLWSVENVSVCPNCASTNLDWFGYYYTYTGYYRSFECLGCGAHGRSRQIETPKEKRKLIVRS